MAKKKKVVRRAWTKDDLRLLKSMAKDKQGVTKIAKALRRSPGATSVMAAKRGVSLSRAGMNRWDCIHALFSAYLIILSVSAPSASTNKHGPCGSHRA